MIISLRSSLVDKINSELDIAANAGKKNSMTNQTLNVSAVLETVRVLSQWMDSKLQFSCFNVTRELRRRKQVVNHKAVLELVHSLNGLNLPPFTNSNYERATKSFTTKSGHGDTVEVYQVNGDTAKYNPDFDLPVKKKPIVNKPVAKAPCKICKQTYPHTGYVTANKPTIKSNTVFSFGVDARGRICIRNKLVGSLSVQPGGRVYLRKTPGGNIILSKNIPQKDYIGSLKVDNHGNVRVSRHLQSKAGLAANKFAMSVVPNGVALIGS